jgi:hypothetical protein
VTLGSDPTVSRDVITDVEYSDLGVLELFRLDKNDGNEFDFAMPEDKGADATDVQQEIKRHRKNGRLCSVYLPVLLFGPSPRSGLTHDQRNILIALTRETTRAKRSHRPDKAAVVVGGEPDAKGTYRFSVCPFLQPGRRYVRFNGNGGYQRRHLRGRGYHLVGKAGKGWLWRAGFTVHGGEDGRRKAVRQFLTVLRTLTDSFGVVAAGWHHRKRCWYSLDDLIAMTSQPAGWARLAQCKLRVYGPEDYIVRWRQYFAARLGFSHIPGDADEGEVAPQPDADPSWIASATDLHVWMCRVGVTDQQLADRLGVTRRLVSGYRSGRRPWSKRFQARLAAAGKAGGEADRKVMPSLMFPNSHQIPSREH